MRRAARRREVGRGERCQLPVVASLGSPPQRCASRRAMPVLFNKRLSYLKARSHPALRRLEDTELLADVDRLVHAGLVGNHVEPDGLGERPALADRHDVANLHVLEGRGAVRGRVLVALLVAPVLPDEVKVVPANHDGALHLRGQNDALQNAATDGNVAGERALLVHVRAVDGALRRLEAEANGLHVAHALCSTRRQGGSKKMLSARCDAHDAVPRRPSRPTLALGARLARPWPVGAPVHPAANPGGSVSGPEATPRSRAVAVTYLLSHAHKTALGADEDGILLLVSLLRLLGLAKVLRHLAASTWSGGLAHRGGGWRRQNQGRQVFGFV